MSARIGVIPDIHMRSAHRSEIRDLLESTASHLRRFDPDLVVALGDVIEEEDERTDAEHVELVAETLAFDCPVRFLAGNHDSETLSHDRLEELFGNELWGSQRIGGEKLVFLNTSSPWLDGARGEVTDDQLSMLREETAAGEPFTIFVHHPIHYYDVSNSYWWSTFPERAFCGNKKRVIDALDPKLVRGVINGHTHENVLTNYRGVEHVTLNAFSKETRERPITGTYAEVVIEDTVDVTVKLEDELVRRYEF
ncbi:metallophosphoesterase [Natrarchaeobius sp. A-rgal3]|uniref:metallophosphoesterase family protein n=1 Tax=Natrarchaeobius versutus TaxID=1679078 RepID=UPI003510A60F